MLLRVSTPHSKLRTSFAVFLSQDAVGIFCLIRDEDGDGHVFGLVSSLVPQHVSGTPEMAGLLNTMFPKIQQVSQDIREQCTAVRQ